MALTKELIEEKDNGWLRDIPEDILIITKDTTGVVIGHPVAYCPIIIMSDKSHGVTALGSCQTSWGYDLGAISKQLDELGIARERTYLNMDDTLTDDRYYSNSGARNNIEKKGRNFVGAYYSDYEDDSFVKKRQ